ncbi:MAG: HAMP domain-containing sensor histidine kinase [bacterium]
MNPKNEQRLKVVIVDDEESMCLGAQRVLKNYSVDIEDIDTRVFFDTKFVTKGNSFLTLLEKEKVDLVLLDYKLPDISGLDLLEHITSNNKDVIAIMITAYATFETAVQATKLGANDFIAKPFTPDELRSSVRKATINLLLARHARRSEEEKKKVRFQFISVLSHELKAPLAAIEGYINILKKRYGKVSEEDYEMMLSRSQIRLEGMRKLIFDLLDLTRIESGDKKRSFDTVDVVDMARTAIEVVNMEAALRNIEIKMYVAGPVHMAADKSEIEIILNNLITNAVKYNRDGGKVDVALYSEGDKKVIKVSDTGIGIAPEDASRLFQEFVRIKNEKTINILGSGLGLSTVKKLSKLYGGDVYLETQPDVGSSFRVELFNTNTSNIIN